MKKFLSFVPFFLACCLLIGAIGWGALVICDTFQEVERLKNLPSASGVDYLGVHLSGVFFGAGVFVASAGGMIFSGISRAVIKHGKVRTASGVLMVLFGSLLLLSVAACMFRWF